MREAHFHELKEEGVFSELDLHFGRFMERLAGASIPEIAALSALLSARTRDGHVCLNLYETPGFPRPKVLLARLKENGVLGAPGEFKPLVADEQGRVYLYRYWEYERKLADWIEAHAGLNTAPDFESLGKRLRRLFPNAAKGEVDWQLVSAFTSTTKRFVVISGGPGTGKTTTAAAILAVLLEEALPAPLRIAMVSPTGKGAARLQTAIHRAKESLDCSEDILNGLPEEASTIHRLLRPIEGSPYFRYNARRNLPIDVLLIDEASMVDLPLMSKLVQALPFHAQLILLGDKDQLASVESGAVLGDICNTGRRSGAYSALFCSNLQKATGYSLEPEAVHVRPIADCIVHLRKNYRFGPESGIAALSSAVHRGDWVSVRTLLKDGSYPEIAWKDLPPPKFLSHALAERALQGFGDIFRFLDAERISNILDHFRVLCALREGPFGAPSINLIIEDILRRKGLVRGEDMWYPGRPVLISRNDYDLRLFNGDTGIVLPEHREGQGLGVFFLDLDHRIRKVHPLRLPEHETCYAMTVHKSQGSEFGRILLILPDRDSPVLTKELVYTAVTRAREGVEIWGREEVLRSALGRRTERKSGIRDALWGTSS